jgi:hypothetical protein
MITPLLESLFALAVVFVPIIGCYMYIEFVDHGLNTLSDDFALAKPVHYSASLVSGRYAHICPVCGDLHFVNPARQSVAYGKQFSCSAQCESIRRKAWRSDAMFEPMREKRHD